MMKVYCCHNRGIFATLGCKCGPDVNPGCYMACVQSPTANTCRKSQVSLSCLQAGLWLLSPWRACGGCSWGGTTITKSVHVQSTASPHPRLLVHILPSVGGGGGISLWIASPEGVFPFFSVTYNLSVSYFFFFFFFFFRSISLSP